MRRTPHYPRTRAYDKPNQLSAFRKALQHPVTAKEVRNLMRVGLKSDEELNPDFPATGEGGGGELMESLQGGSQPTNKAGVVPSPQPSPLNPMFMAFSEVERRLLG